MVRVDERLEGKVRPFDQVAPNLLAQLKSRAIDAERQHLATIYKVAINKELL
jgi:hypothetical protein